MDLGEKSQDGPTSHSVSGHFSRSPGTKVPQPLSGGFAVTRFLTQTWRQSADRKHRDLLGWQRISIKDQNFPVFKGQFRIFPFLSDLFLFETLVLRFPAFDPLCPIRVEGVLPLRNRHLVAFPVARSVPAPFASFAWKRNTTHSRVKRDLSGNYPVSRRQLDSLDRLEPA